MASCVVRTSIAQRTVCVVLATLVACLPSMQLFAETNAAQQANGKQHKAATTSGKIDTTYVTPSAVVMAVFRPAQLMKSKAGEMLPVEVATAAGIKYLGIDPANIDEVTCFADPSNPLVPNYAFTLKFVRPQPDLKLPKEIREQTKPNNLIGKDYLESQNAELPSFYQPDKSTLIIAPDQTLRTLVENPPKSKTGPLIDRVQKVAAGSDLYVAIDLATIRPFIQMGLMGEEVPPQAKPFADMIPLVSAAELTVSLSKPAPTELVVHANDAESADQIMNLFKEGIEKAREQMRDDLAPQMESEDPVERAFAQYMERVSGRCAEPFMPTRDGAKLTLFHIENTGSPQQQFTTMAVMGVLAALLLPATRAAREAARRNQSMNNMKQLAIALQNFHDTKKTFPAQAICDKDGKPLLSWRVAVLPFIEENDLYNQFHLDEPWDSEHNKALLARMPQAFASPNLKLPNGKTTYLAVVGKDCVFDGTDKGIPIQAVKDGTSKTIALVEADVDKAVDWTKPDDLKYDANNPTAGLGHVHPDGWLAAFCDAHVQFINNAVDPNVVKAMFTKASREAIDLP